MIKVAMALLCAMVCSTAAVAQNTSYRADSNWRPPATAIARQNPLASKPEAVAGGRKLFLRHCAECHGSDGAGMEKKHSADLQLSAVQGQSDGSFFWKITNGNAAKGMPAFSSLPELQRWQIVLFLRTLKPADAAYRFCYFKVKGPAANHSRSSHIRNRPMLVRSHLRF